MPVNSDTSPAGPFIGDGATFGPFPFTFKLFATSDLLVQVTDTSGNVSSLTLGSDYSVSLNADQDAAPGGTWQLLLTPLALNYLIVGISNVPFTQQQRLQDLGGFLPTIIVNALDKLTILTYQLLNKVARCISAPQSDTGINLLLPASAMRANKVIGFDATGNILTMLAGGATGATGPQGPQGIPGQDGAGGDMFKSQNLSGLANYATARTNLGLSIGTNVQAYSAALDAVSGSNTGDQVLPIDSTLTVTDNTGNNVSAGHHGFAPKLPNDATKFLNGAGAYAVPTGGSGSIVSRAYAEYTSNAALSTSIPYDDTIPQKTEGTQILSATITPGSATRRIRVRFQGMFDISKLNNIGATEFAAIAALFIDATANALTAKAFAAVASSGDGTVNVADITFEFEHVPGDTAPHTYAIRAGANVNSAIYLNGDGGARKFGGVARATLILEEIVP